METMEALTGDVLDINNEFGTYGEYKAAVDEELQKSAESFVRIGYLLKLARDTDILKESGYRSVNEFAEGEYSLDKSQVSRFIRINDEFSEGGYSDRLQERYRGFGYAKLALMLLLPAEVNEELSAGYTKAEIGMLKDDVAEEMKRTDLEVMMEETDRRQQGFGIFGKAVYEIGKNDPDIYIALYQVMTDDSGGSTASALADILAPAGEAIISLRIAGEGRKMLNIKGDDADPVLIDVRSGGKSSCTWQEFIREIETLFVNGETGREAWEYIYGTPFPEKEEEVAPVQPQKEKRHVKQGRVIRSKEPEDTTDKPAEQEREDEGEQEKVKEEDQAHPDADHEPAAAVRSGDDADGAVTGAGETDPADGESSEDGRAEPEGEEQLEGQMDIEDFPEYMPEGQDNSAGSRDTDETQDDMDQDEAQLNQYDIEEHINDQAKIIIKELDIMRGRCDEKDWDGLIKKAKGVIVRAESIKKIKDAYGDDEYEFKMAFGDLCAECDRMLADL